jgi:Zn-dependent M16 (insulinase) family peptidase
MEQLNADDTHSRTLVTRIKLLLQLASDLITVFDDMLQESNFKPDLARRRQWIEDAKANIKQYREGLWMAASEADARKVSLWSSQLFQSYKQISDVAIPTRSQNKMLTVAGEIDDAGRSIFGDIDVFDPKNLEIMNAALQDFKE